MNLEDFKPPEEKRVTPKRLLDVCQRFADVLANGQWLDNENREVGVTRTFTEVIGHPVTVKEELIREITLRTEASFRAQKKVVSRLDEAEIVLNDVYVVTVKWGEVLPYSYVPNRVLAEFAKHVEILDDDDEEDEDEDRAEDEFEIEGDDEESDVMTLARLTPEMLEQFKFAREYEMSYTIDSEGNIDDYGFVIRYQADGQKIDESHYELNNPQRVYDATIDPSNYDEKIVEWVLTDQPDLEEADITRFIDSLEQTIEKILEAEEFDALEGAYYEGYSHHWRALGFIAMAAVNFKHMKL